MTDSPTFPGSSVPPTDPRYPTLVRGFNQRWVGHPQYVQVVGDAEQIVRTIQQCVDHKLRPTVRSGGHCYEGWVSLNDGVILDVSSLHKAGWDEENGWFFLESGCTNWDIYNQLYRQYGLTLPAGSCYSVGAGGHICGGGYGLLSRLQGLTVDWLSGVEVVVVDRDRRARLVRVMADAKDLREADLAWGHTGGGGGNFGVITRYLFRKLPEAPSEAWLASLSWEWSELLQHPDQFFQILANYGRFFADHSAPGSRFSTLFALLHLTRKAGEQVTLTVQNVGSDRGPLDDFLAFMRTGLDLRRVRIVAPRVPVGWHHFVARSTDARRMPWLEATQTLNGSGSNQRGKYKSAYMKQPFPEKQAETIWKWLTIENDRYPANSQALLQVDSYGCQINDVDPAATAVPQRSSILKLQYQTYWTEPAQDKVNLDWINDFYAEMYGPRGPWPDDVVDGCYVNYCDSDLMDWQHLYYKDNYTRLQRAKQEWDPHNVFHHGQSIELP
ncbi:MAG TPA: FAD-binding protein [Thermoanaerobaculia bacterium]|jgi:FAD/FMN-containing dehydrogenase|nr:FAD-binding protein [Thermoanaerobaculia bacterium]